MCYSSIHNPVEVTIHSTITIPGFSLYRKFKQIISLSQILRQGPNEVIPKEILERQGMGIYTESDYNILRCRFIKPRLDEVVITLYATNAVADSHKIKSLNHSTEPMFLIKEYHDGNIHTGSPKDHSIGLLPQLNLTIDIQVILTKNLYVSVGLANGTMGKVVAFLKNDFIDSSGTLEDLLSTGIREIDIYIYIYDIYISL